MSAVSRFMKDIFTNRIMLLMVLPGALWFLFFSYIPMAGAIIAFKEYRVSRGGF